MFVENSSFRKEPEVTSSRSSETPTADVAVLGCGNLGSAIARTFAANGHDVVVWNRTHEKACALSAERLTPAETVEEAASAAPVVVLVVSSYEDALAVLSQLGSAQPEVVVNLTTGYADDAQRAWEWCRTRGVPYLDGAVIAYPDQVGRADTTIFVSGDPAHWRSCAPLITDLGGATRHVGDAIGSANVLDTGIVGAFYLSALGAFMESLAYMLDAGATEVDVAHAVDAILPVISHSLNNAVSSSASKSYDTDQATLQVIVDSMRGFASTIKDSGHSAQCLDASLKMCESASSRADQQLAFYAVVESLRHDLS